MTLQTIVSVINSPNDKDRLSKWTSSIPAFSDFLEVNESKILKKIKVAITDEDKKDVMSELDIAARCLLAYPDSTVSYEPYGGAARRNPDLLVKNIAVFDFNVEVKRIRESASTKNYDDCLAAIVSAFRDVKSPLGVDVKAITLDPAIDLPERLKAALPDVADYVRSRVEHYASTLPPGEEVAESIPDFEGELDLVFCHVSGKDPETPTANFTSSAPVFYKQKESFKYSDHICSALGQLRDNLANVLAILCDSTTHEPEEVCIALQEMHKRACKGDDDFFQQKKLGGAHDYLEQLKLLSAIVVCSKYFSIPNVDTPNYVWANPDAAYPLQQEALSFMAVM